MSLFDNDPGSDRRPSQRPPFTLRNRSIYFWLNVGFAVVVAGLLFGFSGQPWYLVVAASWVIVNLVVAIRSSRNQPPPPNLFED
jgi:hypothetical protein